MSAATYRTDAARWEAVLQRDAGAADAFVYAVRTTNIYCQPGCASRLPNRTNVEYFADPGEARRAGYRACKRCRPDQSAEGVEQALAEKACRTIEASDAPVSLGDLAAASELSPSHFQKIFKKTVGLTPKQYAVAHRTERFRRNLRNGTSVSAAIQETGFGSSSRAYEKVQEHLGMNPSTYRSGGIGLTIRYAVSTCRLGSVAVAATDKGICAIELGDSKSDVRRHLEARFPKAAIKNAESGFTDTVRKVVEFLDAPEKNPFDLPLDIQGTAFQHRVWRALTELGSGETVSYSELAERVGRPGAARAVGSAVSRNAIAVAIPCHRVVRNDGGLGGYHWGEERKRELLERERARAGEG